ncbi:MAG: hypothetical protein AB8G22_15060 [Saprospiraceae bacterium]
MKKSSILYLLLIALIWTACGSDTIINELQTEQTVLSEQATKIAAAVEQFKGESQQLKQLATNVADNPQIAILLEQYDDINGSLENIQSWYKQSSNIYGNLMETSQSGKLTEKGLKSQTKAIQDKMEAMNEKATMTIEELGRMRGEIETAVKNVTEAATTTPEEE